jgi:hypothetical protein
MENAMELLGVYVTIAKNEQGDLVAVAKEGFGYTSPGDGMFRQHGAYSTYINTADNFIKTTYSDDLVEAYCAEEHNHAHVKNEIDYIFDFARTTFTSKDIEDVSCEIWNGVDDDRSFSFNFTWRGESWSYFQINKMFIPRDVNENPWLCSFQLGDVNPSIEQAIINHPKVRLHIVLN